MKRVSWENRAENLAWLGTRVPGEVPGEDAPELILFLFPRLPLYTTHQSLLQVRTDTKALQTRKIETVIQGSRSTSNKYLLN